MTISQGGLIQAVDYNTLRTGVSNLLGDGYGDRGYGQTVAADIDVIAGTTVVSATPTTLKQWVALYGDMKKIADHQGTDITTLKNAYDNNIKSGSLIQYSDINLIATTLATLDTNRLTIGDQTQYSIESLASSQRTTQWGSPVKPTVQHTFRIEFGSAADARYFFNAGGQILFTASRSGGTTPWTQNSDWTTLLSAMGTIAFGYSGVTASSGNTVSGFKDVTTATLIYSKGGYGGAGGTTYAANDYNITATLDSGKFLTFNIYFNDDKTTLFANQDYVDGTLTSTIQIKRPSGTNVSLVKPNAVNTAELSA